MNLRRFAAATTMLFLSSHAGRAAGPDLLHFDELRALAVSEITPGLKSRLDAILERPFVHALGPTSYARRTPPTVAFWNIERGRDWEGLKAAFSGPVDFSRAMSRRKHMSVRELERVERDVEALGNTDVLILNEVDVGMKRSGYLDLPRELASQLRMHAVFGVEFVEIDRLYTGEEQIKLDDAALSAELADSLRVDPAKYRGLHGNAVLSRYPIRSARIHRLGSCYDWFDEELEGIAAIEKGRRWSAKRVFNERIRRQVRRGGRMALIVELETPHLPGGVLTAVSTHLEDRATSSCRRQQAEELLRALAPIRHTVIIGGDLNTTGSDGTPTSVRREIMNRITNERFWVRQSVYWFSPVTIPRLVLLPINYIKNFRDPTAVHIPLIARNRSRHLFRSLQQFRFDDGGRFDFSGSSDQSGNGRARTLANSNERAWKGFKPSFQFERNYFGLIGTYRLDWIFVKPPGIEGSLGLLPHTPRTLAALNNATPDRISDHHPILVHLTAPRDWVTRPAESVPAKTSRYKPDAQPHKKE